MDGNTEAPAAKLPTLLEQIESAKSIDEFDRVEAGLAEMEQRFKGVVYADISTKDGLAKAKADRVEIREVRYGVSAKAKGMKDPLNRLKKLIDGQAERIEARVLKIEEPIDAQIKAEEQRIEAEKERKKAVAEALRKVRLDKIDAMRNAPVALTGASAEKIAEALGEIQGREITLDEFGDLAGAAMTAQNAAAVALTAMHAAAIAAEQQAEELRKLREESAARRAAEEAEAEKRRAAEAEAERKRKAEEAEAQKQRDAEAAAEQERLKQQAEAERIAREKSEAELADLRAKLAALQAAQKPVERAPVLSDKAEADANAVAFVARISNGEIVDAEFTPPTDADPGDEAAPVPVFKPSRDILIDAVGSFFSVTSDIAEDWLVSTFGGAK